MFPMLTIQMVGWNSAAILPAALRVLKNVPISDVVVRYIDNGSADKSVEIVREMLSTAEVIELGENKGFAKAHNIGFNQCDTEFVMTHDPDLVINWDSIKKLIEVFRDDKVGAVQGKVLRSESSKGSKDGDGQVIDSAGIELTLALNGKERGANEIDRGQFDEVKKVLAVTGAAGIYRMAALKEVAHGPGEFFDNDFFAYKEDVDLGWRLNNAGWVVMYHPVLMGVHKRTLGKRGFMNWGLNPVEIYHRLGSKRTHYSLRNWIWMILKDATIKQELMHEIFIDIRLLVFGLLSLLYWPLFGVWWEIVRGIPIMMEKRSHHKLKK